MSEPFVSIPLYVYENLNGYLSDLDIYLNKLLAISKQTNFTEGETEIATIVMGCKVARQTMEECHQGKVRLMVKA